MRQSRGDVPDKIERAGENAGNCGGDRTETGERRHRASRGRRSTTAAFAIERDQVRGFAIALLGDVNRAPAGHEPIEQSSQQNGACAVNAPHVRQIELNGAAAMQRPLRVRDGLGRGCCVREIEGTSGRQTHAVALPVRPNDDACGAKGGHDTFPMQRHERP